MMKLRRLIGASPPTPRRSAAPILGFVLVAALVLAGCGAESGAREGDEANASEAVAEGDPLLDFYQCLRDNGLDVADPAPGERIGLQGVDTEDPATQTIVEDCRDTHLSSTDGRVTVGGGNMGDNVADTENLIAFVDCMREHGIDMPDPAPDGRLQLPENTDAQSAELREAGRECSSHLDGGRILVGEPGSGGGGTVRRNP